MATYKQIHSWREDGWGQVSVLFRLSDTYAGLFAADGDCEEANIFLLDQVAKDVSTKAGGLAEHELTFQINEAAILSQSDTDALTFVKTARSPANIVFCAVFIDTGATPSTDDLVFSGVIQPEQEANDRIWHGEHYDQDPAPLRKWSVKARPFSNAIMDKFSLAELIDGTDDGPAGGGLYIDPIDTTWETANVFDGQGWFSKTIDGVVKTTKVNSLIALDAVLRKLADQLEAGLLSKFGITMNINYERSLMEGLWHPARWLHDDVFNKHPRWVGRKYESSTNKVKWRGAYIVDYGDKQLAAIDPDYVGGGGSAVPSEQFYISYRLIKLQDDEPDSAGAKSLMFKTKCTSFTDFIYKLAISLGCYVFMEMTDSENLSIKFIRRQSFVGTRLYLKTSSSAKIRGTSKSLDESVLKKLEGRATPYAMEGADVYFKNLTSDKPFLAGVEWTEAGVMSSENSDKATSDDLLVTIAPTVCDIVNITQGGWVYLFKDSGWKWHKAGMPHNHYAADNGSAHTQPYMYATGIHTALYMYVDKLASHTYADYEPANYYTPAAAISVRKNKEFVEQGKGKWFDYDTYYELSDYLNNLLGFDSEYFNVEYELVVPFYYGLSESSDGSGPDWRNIELGTQLVLDGVTYIIESIKYNLSKSSLILKMSGAAKYDFDTVSITSVPDIIHPPNSDEDAPAVILIEANEAIDEGNYVALRTDGKIEVMKEENTYYGRLLGIALQTAAASGDYIYVQTSGIVYLDNASFTAGENVFVNTNASNPYNISHTALTAKSGSLDLHAVVGIANSTNEVTLLEEPLEYIYP